MQAAIKGTTMPILEVSLGQGEAVVSTHGELAWMTQSIQMSQRMNTGGAADSCRASSGPSAAAGSS
jgi:uncharacterized protein (AIM24 family)